VFIAALTAMLVITGCSDRGGDGGDSEDVAKSTAAQSATSSDFGDLSKVCQSGSPQGSPTRGVTESEIRVGVMSDIGFTKVSEFVDAAEVFTSWCNDNGGINGRKLVATTRDTKLMEIRQRMIDACREDFALVGGGAALDGLGVKERLTCGLPSFPAQVSQSTSVGADLEISADASLTPGYDSYFGYRQWLMKDAYPGSASAIGLVNGDSPVTKSLGAQAVEAVEAAGGTFVYNDLYPAIGVTDWTPYAQSIKSNGVKGLIFLGLHPQLAKLESALTSMDYKLDWIDTNNNAYGQQFIDVAGTSATYQNNYLDLGGNVPLDSDEPAMRQLNELWAQYAPDAELTLPAIRAMSAWLLFARSAAQCGDDLTRTCLYENAKANTAWTAGGLHTPRDLAEPTPPSPCFNVVKSTAEGWEAADFNPDEGIYRCDVPAYKYTQDYGKPMTLADVGKTMADVE